MTKAVPLAVRRGSAVYTGGPARLLTALHSREALWARRWEILDEANGTVFDRLRDEGMLRNEPDPRLVGVLVCGVATAVEEGRLPPRRRKALLRVVVDGILR